MIIKKMYYILTLIGLTIFSVSTLIVNAVEAASSLPNYANGVKAVDKKLYTGKNAIKVNQQDMAVMTKAAKDLAVQMPDPGIKVGEKAPNFSLKNPNGKMISLSTMLKKGPVILTFYRGAWCPYCNLQLHQLTESLPQFKKYGATIVAVTPQQPDQTSAQFKADGYPFEVLSDLDYQVIKSYKLYWEVSSELDAAYKHAFGLDVSKFNGKDRRGLPIPGTFVIDKNAVVRAAFADTDYKKRMEPADIMLVLQQISKN